MATNAQREDAYLAGRGAASITWPDDAPEHQRTPGEHHCPFGLDMPEQRREWLRGLADALEAPRYNPASIVRTLRDAVDVADGAVKS